MFFKLSYSLVFNVKRININSLLISIVTGKHVIVDENIPLRANLLKSNAYAAVCSISPAFIFPKFLVAFVMVIKSQSPLGASVASHKNA